MDEIVRKTKAIAAFMGVVPEETMHDTFISYWYDGPDLSKAGLPFACGMHGNGTYNPPFHSDWNWIIPVIRRIGDVTGYELIITSEQSAWNRFGDNPFPDADFQGYSAPLNEGVWIAVVEMIEWCSQ